MLTLVALLIACPDPEPGDPALPADTDLIADTGDTGLAVEGDPGVADLYSHCVGVESRDHDADGRPESATTTWHDGAGEAVRLEHDDPFDGVVDGVDVHAWEGGLWTGSTWDHDGNGTVDMVYERIHDGQGQLLWERSDLDADGDAEVVAGHTWEGGQLVGKTHDFDGDGRPDVVEAYSWEGGLLVYWTWDAGADGVDQSRSWGFDALDQVVLDELDSDHDGETDQRYTYAWDGDLMVEERYDTDADGDLERRFVHAHDRQGRRVRTALDSDGDGDFDERADYTWSGDRQVRQRTDAGADGTWDLVIERVWDGDRVVAVREDSDGDGTWDREERYAWDEAGRPLSVEVDYGADGVVDRRTTWTWDC